jgi:hypothetical protein
MLKSSKDWLWIVFVPGLYLAAIFFGWLLSLSYKVPAPL